MAIKRRDFFCLKMPLMIIDKEHNPHKILSPNLYDQAISNMSDQFNHSLLNSQIKEIT